ncbi:MAG: cysteine desulfurase [Firmicutes bacterium]|nr:cysteine desulfurase [Bacillota bacterium]
MKSIYLDYAATTPLSSEVVQAMQPYLNQKFGNPSSMHQLGIANKKIINDARKTIATCLNVKHEEIFFTSGGTEATNWAIKGYAFAHPDKKEIITSQIEHHATLHTCQFMETQGYQVHYIPVDKNGFIYLKKLEKLITDKTLMVTIIWANNEIGTIQDLKSISEICERNHVALHVDAVQAYGQLSIDLSDYHLDMLTLSAHKFYGPKGVGCLYIKKGTAIEPLIHGGSQELGKRSGTENLSGIVGMAKAAELAFEHQLTYYAFLRNATFKLYERISRDFKCILNGVELGNKRLPGHLSISFPDIIGSQLSYWLDQNDIFVSTGSACNSILVEPSHVLKAIKVPEAYINGTIRITLGKEFLESDIPRIIAFLKEGIDYIS